MIALGRKDLAPCLVLLLQQAVVLAEDEAILPKIRLAVTAVQAAAHNTEAEALSDQVIHHLLARHKVLMEVSEEVAMAVVVVVLERLVILTEPPKEEMA